MKGLPRELTEDEKAEIAATITDLTLDQKASLTAGRDIWGTNAIPSAGIPSWRMTDGPNGARGTMLGPAGVRALCMPSGSALAATWNLDLVREVGVALGQEARARSARVLLAPTVNIQRSPLGGRTFECFSEDPLLAGRMAAAYVQGVQSQGVVTTVKHLAGNEAEFQRHSINSVIDERSLRELYLPPFEMAIKDGGALGIMTSYNRLNGSFCADDAWLLGEVLRNEWGFDGIVVSDWWALCDTVAAATAGLDVEMPGPARSFGAMLSGAVERGNLAPERLDAMVERTLSVMTRMDARADPSDGPERSITDPALFELARRAAADAMVLVKNEGHLLPINPLMVKRLALIGHNATRSQIMGGGSASLRAHHRTSPFSALSEALADSGVELLFEQGCGSGVEFEVLDATELRTPEGEPGIEVSFFAGKQPLGDPVAVHLGDTTELQFMGEPAEGVPAHSFCIRAAGFLTATYSGVHRFRLATNAAARLFLNGDERLNLGWMGDNPARTEKEAEVSVELAAGACLEITLEFAGESELGFCQAVLKCARPVPADAMDAAARTAASADVAIVVVGTTQSLETEGADRTSLMLPGDQDELVRRVAAANPNTVVVVNSGSPVTLPWLTNTPAVLQCWFGGQEMASALAEVLLGVQEPGGRMPITFPARIEHTPAFGNFPGEAGEVRYGEGLLVGYRWYEARHLPVTVPFGHGRGYTNFEWSSAALNERQIAAGESVAVTVDIRNTGGRRGSEVVQVYVTPPKSPLSRPPKELQGFAKVTLDAGQCCSVVIELEPRRFAYWHPGDEATEAIHDRLQSTPFSHWFQTPKRTRGWTIEPGDYMVHIARSSVDVVASLPLFVEGLVQGMRP